jgi:tripartite-type tricarboxylate transporter receptor subunit TctC
MLSDAVIGLRGAVDAVFGRERSIGVNERPKKLSFAVVTCGTYFVVTGLVPVTPRREARHRPPKRDGRDKPGHDGKAVKCCHRVGFARERRTLKTPDHSRSKPDHSVHQGHAIAALAPPVKSAMMAGHTNNNRHIPGRTTMSAWVRSLAIAFAAAAWLAPANAQQYPSQDIRLICGYPAGSGADVIVRYYAQKLKEITGRTVLVENKVGAMGNLATEHSARAKPDGHTIYLNGGGVIAANMYMFKKPPVDILKELQAVGGINKLSGMLVVRTDRPWKTLAELTAYLKEKGDKASYASTNPVALVTGEIYKQKAGLSTVQVSYKTGFDSANDLQSGQVDYAMVDPVYGLAQRREGRVRVLAMSSGERLESLPDIPTFTEQGHPDGHARLVGRVRAGGDAAPDRRSDQRLVRADPAHAGDDEVLQQLRQRSVHSDARSGTGAAHRGREELGRLRENRQDRAAGINLE